MNLHDEIAEIAYELFESRGRVHGYDLDDWLNAERIVLTEHSGQDMEEPEEEDVLETVAVGAGFKKVPSYGTDETEEYINEEMS